MRPTGGVTPSKTELAAVALLLLGAAFLGGLFLGRGTGRARELALPEPLPAVEPQSAAETQSASDAVALVDLNTATEEELITLPGIGPVLAERIVAYRIQYGPFLAVEELLGVEGIGEKTLEELQTYVTVGTPADQYQEVQK